MGIAIIVIKQFLYTQALATFREIVVSAYQLGNWTFVFLVLYLVLGTAMNKAIDAF